MAPRFGIDIDKARLTIAQAGVPGTKTVENTAQAISDWLASLPESSAIAVESSGRCHDLLLALACTAACAVYLLNPLDVRRYAQGIGRRAKTDAVDAHVIARYLDREIADLRPYTALDPAFAALRRVVRHRATLVKHRQALRASLAGTPWLSQIDEALTTSLNAIDAHITALLNTHAAARDLRQRLLTVPGIGPVASASLVSLLHPIAFDTADALVAYVGLDPRPCDSGMHRGQRVLTKRGDPEIRRVLYLAAQAFARTIGKALYERYRARALSATATYVILARKLLRIAWAIQQRNTSFDPQRFAMG